jgi:hypothetical protein
LKSTSAWAFEDLKLAIINLPVLRMAHVFHGFILQIITSSLVVATVLLQDFQGDRHPIAFSS